MPAPVLRPAFHTARDDGYLTGSDDELRLTESGKREIEKLVTATRAWLASELADWGAADDDLLTQALHTMARKFVDEDPELLPSPARALPAN